MTVLMSKRISRGAQVIANYPTVYSNIPAPVENLIGSPAALPTSQPGSPQYTVTITSGDLPALNYGFTTGNPQVMLVMGGLNNDASARTVSILLKRNGGTLTTYTSSIAASTYWTFQYWSSISAWNVGDTLTAYIWAASSTNCVYDYNAYWIRFSSITNPSHVGWVLKNLVQTQTAYPTLTLGTPAVYGAIGNDLFNLDTTQSDYIGYYGVISPISLAWQGPTHGLIRPLESGLVEWWPHATYRPYYNTTKIVTALSYTPLMKIP